MSDVQQVLELCQVLCSNHWFGIAPPCAFCRGTGGAGQRTYVQTEGFMGYSHRTCLTIFKEIRDNKKTKTKEPEKGVRRKIEQWIHSQKSD